MDEIKLRSWILSEKKEEDLSVRFSNRLRNLRKKETKRDKSEYLTVLGELKN